MEQDLYYWIDLDTEMQHNSTGNFRKVIVTQLYMFTMINGMKLIKLKRGYKSYGLEFRKCDGMHLRIMQYVRF